MARSDATDLDHVLFPGNIRLFSSSFFPCSPTSTLNSLIIPYDTITYLVPGTRVCDKATPRVGRDSKPISLHNRERCRRLSDVSTVEISRRDLLNAAIFAVCASLFSSEYCCAFEEARLGNLSHGVCTCNLITRMIHTYGTRFGHAGVASEAYTWHGSAAFAPCVPAARLRIWCQAPGCCCCCCCCCCSHIKSLTKETVVTQRCWSPYLVPGTVLVSYSGSIVAVRVTSPAAQSLKHRLQTYDDAAAGILLRCCCCCSAWWSWGESLSSRKPCIPVIHASQCWDTRHQVIALKQLSFYRGLFRAHHGNVMIVGVLISVHNGPYISVLIVAESWHVTSHDKKLHS